MTEMCVGVGLGAGLGKDTGFGSVEELVRFKDTNTEGRWEEVGCNNEAEDESMWRGSELKVEERMDGKSLGLKCVLWSCPLVEGEAGSLIVALAP